MKTTAATPSAPAVSALVDACRAIVAEADTPPPVTLGDENPWNHVRYGERRPAPTYALALFPGDAAQPVHCRRVMVLESWEGVAFACVEVDAYGIPEKRDTANHVLPEARVVLFCEVGKKRVAPGAELAAKRAAYAATLALFPSGPLSNSDFMPSPSARSASAQAKGGTVLSAPEARAARKDASDDGQRRVLSTTATA